MAKQWSPAEDTFLFANNEFLTVAELAKALGCSAGVTRGRLVKLNLTKISQQKRICQNSECYIVFYVSSFEAKRNKSIYCSNECSQFVRKLPVPSREELFKLYSGGMSTNDLAKHFKLSKGTIYNLFKRYKLKGRDGSLSQIIFFDSDSGFQAKINRLNTLNTRYNKVSFGGTFHAGKRKDLPSTVAVRSAWEADCLRVLTYQGFRWEYEPQNFRFYEIKKGTLSYTPDIKVFRSNLDSDYFWIEVKGRLNPASITKTRRFKKYYPEEFERLQVIVSNPKCEAAQFYASLDVPVYAYYRDLRKQFKPLIPNWEST